MLKYKQHHNALVEKLDPVIDYLNNCNGAPFDWTTSLPISSPPLSVKQKAADACLKENMHTYYNSDINDDLIGLITEYFGRKSIVCSKRDIKIRYSSFDILRDFYASLDWDENDAMLICAPTFGYYIYQAAAYNITTELIHARQENGWKIKPDDLDRALSNPKIKLFLLTNPVNPTGVFYAQEEIEQLAAIIKKHDVFVISDEIFSDIYFDQYKKPYSIAAVDGMYERSLTLSGLGKSRGVRLSFSCGPTPHINLLPVSGILKPLQTAAIEALKNTRENQSYLESTLDQYTERITCVQNQIRSMNAILNEHYKTRSRVYVDTFIVPASANLFLLSFPGILGCEFDGKKINDSLDLAQHIFKKVGVATVPGEGFFIEGSEMVLRIPLSVEIAELSEGLNKILQALIS